MKSEIVSPTACNFPALYGLVDVDIIVLCTARNNGMVMRDEHQHRFKIGSWINPEHEGDWEEEDWKRLPIGFKLTLIQE
jgi:hypothetical protein